MVKLFVGNLVEDIDNGVVKRLFEEHGKVDECDVLGKFGFVVSILQLLCRSLSPQRWGPNLRCFL